MNSFLQSKQEKFILFGVVVASLLLAYALFAQHVGGYQPCVQCIYQRFAVLIILVGGLLALTHHWLRPLGLLIALAAAVWGVLEANVHIGVMAGTINEICPFRPNFGFLGRLDEALPWFFEAIGDCSDDSWNVLGLSMPEWLKFIFLCFILSIVVMLIGFTKNLLKKS